MKFKYLFFLLFTMGIIAISSCEKEDLFDQPSIVVTGYSLAELPGEYTHLNIDLQVINNDSKEAEIKDVEYTAIIEGITSEQESATIGKKIYNDTPLEITLPLTLLTTDAIQLLAKLDAGEELSYSVDGTFHLDKPVLDLIDLPIDIEGSACVEAGFEEFYEQPNVTVNDLSGAYVNESSTYTFDFDIDCSVQNVDSRAVKIDEVEYVVYIEGLESETHLYSEAYSTDLVFNGSSTVQLNLPVTLNLNSTEGEALAQAINDGTIEYVVEGTFHVVELEGTTTDFYLPLYLTGDVSADIVGDLFQQPTIEVTGYSLTELPGEYAYIDITMLVTNNDTREAFITDVEYQVTIDGFTSAVENEVINQTILVGTPLELTLPLTLVTEDAIQLLSKLDAGEELSYAVTGTFHVDKPVLNLFDLPIDINGVATVDAGFEDFYEQPNVTVNEITGGYSINGITSYTFDLDVDCTVENLDTRNVIIDEVEYVVFIEGVESETHLYTDAYSTDISIAGSGQVDLNLPVTLNLGIAGGATLASAMLDGYVDYIVEGTFHVISVDGTTADFSLPLYVTGTVPATLVEL